MNHSQLVRTFAPSAQAQKAPPSRAVRQIQFVSGEVLTRALAVLAYAVVWPIYALHRVRKRLGY